jgi:predicted dehydrogenase
LFEVTFAAPHGDCGKNNGYTVIGSDGWLTVTTGPHVEEGSDTPITAVKVTINKTIKTKKENGDIDVKVETEVIHERSRGVEVEIASFVGAIEGHDDGHGFGQPRNALKDVAVIEAALNSEGKYVNLQALVRP